MIEHIATLTHCVSTVYEELECGILIGFLGIYLPLGLA